MSPGTASNHRLADQLARLLPGVVLAVGAGPPVDQPVGVEDQGGAGFELGGLLVEQDLAAHARRPQPEHAALAAEGQLADLAVGDQQRRVVPGVGELQHPRPGVVDEVGARHQRRPHLVVAGRGPAGPLPLRPGHGAHPLVQLAQDVGGRLVVLGEGAQRGAQLAHHGGGARAAALHVADDQAHPARRQRDHVVPVAADLGLYAVPVRLQRTGRLVPPGDLQAVQPGRPLAGQQVLLEGQRGLALLLEQQRVVDGQRDPAGDGAHQVAVERVVVRVGPPGQVGQRHAHHAQQLAAHQQRRGDHRGEPELVAQVPAGRVGRGEAVPDHVLDQHRVAAVHGLGGEVPRRVGDRLADLGPGAGRRGPVGGVPGHPPVQPVAAEQVDEAVVGELRHQGLGDAAQRGLQLQRPGQPLAHPLQQAVALVLALVAAQRLPGEDHHAVDGAGRVAQRHGVRAGVDGGAVGAQVAERALPHAALEDVPGQLGGLLVVLLGDAERQHRVADQVVAAEAEQPAGELVAVDDVAEAVADDDRHLHLVQHRLGRQLRLERRFVRSLHRAVRRLPAAVRDASDAAARAGPGGAAMPGAAARRSVMRPAVVPALLVSVCAAAPGGRTARRPVAAAALGSATVRGRAAAARMSLVLNDESALGIRPNAVTMGRSSV